ncbi:MAG: metal ABC transporter permease [Roseovarius sp.]|nr:metal ABC transporter permease [Roseovarius sp.]MCY4292335.1 metal ABC transporter permease [Roseovarius sp.]
MLIEALTLQLGYNATLVAAGAALLGMACGATGTFLYLGNRALISDAISHSSLPGLALAFIAMAWLGMDGRSLPVLLVGSALSAFAGLHVINWLSAKTRLAEDAAIGAVLSVFFGLGIVLLTVIQSMEAGRQAGLEDFLLGSTAGMLWNDAITIAVGGALVLLFLTVFARPMAMVAFDPEFAAVSGIDTRQTVMITMGLALGVTVVGIKVAGLILIVALVTIPAVAARFWTSRVRYMVVVAGAIGAACGYLGAAISATVPDLPTGPIIVMVAFAAFLITMLVAPGRGVLAVILRHRRFQNRVHVRQGLLALAQGQPIYERLTIRLLRRRGLVRADGVATEKGRAKAAIALLDERRWQILRSDPAHEVAASSYNGLTPLESVLTLDQIAEIDKALRLEAVK